MNKTVSLMIAASIVVLADCASNKPKAGKAFPNTEASELLLDHLVGKWILAGTLAGKKTTHDVEAEWVLSREYLRLHEVSRDQDADGRPAYEAIVLIGRDPRSSECSILWLDSTGGGGLARGATIGRGKPIGGTIPFLFKFAGGIRFHNTFIYASDTDTWRWVMDNEVGRKSEPFGRVTLTREK